MEMEMEIDDYKSVKGSKYIPFGAVMPRWKGLIKDCFSAALILFKKETILSLFRLISRSGSYILPIAGEMGQKKKELEK